MLFIFYKVSFCKTLSTFLEDFLVTDFKIVHVETHSQKISKNIYHILVGWGQWEEGIAGTIIKDTWTKSGGMVRVQEGGGFSWGRGEGRGEKAYNCN